MPLADLTFDPWYPSPMHGLRCSPAIPGFTRLLDEWVVGLTRYADREGGVFEDPERFASSFADAITRVRAFAYAAGEVPETQWTADGATFELQGYPYLAARETLVVSDPADLTEQAEAAMTRAAEAARGLVGSGKGAAESAGTDGGDDEAPIAVGLVFVRVTGTPGSDARAFRDATRQLASTGAAWSFPTAAEGPEYAYAGEGSLGGIVLARRLDT